MQKEGGSSIYYGGGKRRINKEEEEEEGDGMGRKQKATIEKARLTAEDVGLE